MQNKGMIKDLILSFLGEKKDLLAFSLYDGEKITNISYEQFAYDIQKTAGYFVENQITGRHIGIAASNSYRWLVVFFAVISTGNVGVPLNPALPADMLQWQCEKADITLLCYDGSEICEKIKNISEISFDAIYGCELLDIQVLHSHDEDETVLMMFTSGTTGKSKAVMLTMKNLATSVNNVFSDIKKTSGKQEAVVELLCLPLFHVGSLRSVFNSLVCGGIQTIGRGAKYIFMDMPKLNPTRVAMVPAMAESLAKIMRRTPADKMVNYVGNNFRCIVAAGASMKATVASYLMEQGVAINVLYGMTESVGDGTYCALDTVHIGTIGKPDGNIEMKIEDGEILLRSEAVMKGYYNDPEETAKVIVDGWLHTGDMGYCDEDGYYYITGRKKNVIILSNGENVNPEEIEATFSECEGIEECLVYSDGKGICADVFASNQQKVEVFIQNYNESMPMYRQVYKVNYTSEPLPKTGSGKIKRKENK